VQLLRVLVPKCVISVEAEILHFPENDVVVKDHSEKEKGDNHEKAV